MQRNRFFNFCIGHLSKKLSVILVVLVIVLFYTFMVTAALLYPGDYDFITMSISALGNPDKNPFPGWIFFSLAVSWISIAIFPLYLRACRQLKQYNKVLVEIMLVFCAISSGGLFLLGCFSERHATEIMHYIAAGMAFGGLFMAAIFWWILLGKYLKATNQCGKTPAMIIFIVMIATLMGSIVGLATSQIIASSSSFQDISLWFLIFGFWEWTSVTAINIQLFLLSVIVPA